MMLINWVSGYTIALLIDMLYQFEFSRDTESRESMGGEKERKREKRQRETSYKQSADMMTEVSVCSPAGTDTGKYSLTDMFCMLTAEVNLNIRFCLCTMRTTLRCTAL